MFESYYTPKDLFNYGALLNFVLSDRRDGKTVNIKARGWCNFIDHKAQYVYARRYDSEFPKAMYETFYNDVIDMVRNGTFVYEDERIKTILNYDFLQTKAGVYVREKGSDKWETLCYFIPISKSGKLKSTLAIERVEEIDYDEFVPLDGMYLKDEMTLLIELYKSVDSDRNKTLLNMFGNRIDEFNPFFDFFDIHLGIQKEKIRLYKGGTIAVQIYVNNEHREKRAISRFNQMIKDTPYEAYNDGGTLIDRNIKIRKTDGARYFASFKTVIGDGSIYITDDSIIVSGNIRKDGELITDKIYDTKRKQFLCTFGDIPNLIKRTYKMGQLFYTNKEVYHLFEPILNKIGGMRQC